MEVRDVFFILLPLSLSPPFPPFSILPFFLSFTFCATSRFQICEVCLFLVAASVIFLFFFIRPHLAKYRKIAKGQKIHESVWDLPKYQFKAQLYGVQKWNPGTKSEDLCELDPYTSSSVIMKSIAKSPILSGADINALDILRSRGSSCLLQSHCNGFIITSTGNT